MLAPIAPEEALPFRKLAKPIDLEPSAVSYMGGAMNTARALKPEMVDEYVPDLAERTPTAAPAAGLGR